MLPCNVGLGGIGLQIGALAEHLDGKRRRRIVDRDHEHLMQHAARPVRHVEGYGTSFHVG